MRDRRGRETLTPLTRFCSGSTLNLGVLVPRAFADNAALLPVAADRLKRRGGHRHATSAGVRLPVRPRLDVAAAAGGSDVCTSAVSVACRAAVWLSPRPATAAPAAGSVRRRFRDRWARLQQRSFHNLAVINMRLEAGTDVSLILPAAPDLSQGAIPLALPADAKLRDPGHAYTQQCGCRCAQSELWGGDALETAPRSLARSVRQWWPAGALPQLPRSHIYLPLVHAARAAIRQRTSFARSSI